MIVRKLGFLTRAFKARLYLTRHVAERLWFEPLNSGHLSFLDFPCTDRDAFHSLLNGVVGDFGHSDRVALGGFGVRRFEGHLVGSRVTSSHGDVNL